MKPQQIQHVKLSVIEVLSNRQRSDYGDLDGLKSSISKIGLINPISVAFTGDGYYLLAGGRRLQAATELEWDTVPCMIWDSCELDMTAPSLIELEENIKRKDLDWREEALACIKLHDLHCSLDEDWNVSNTADVLSIGGRTASRLLSVGRAVEQGNEAILECGNISAAAAALSRQTQRTVDDETAVLLDNVNIDVGDLENLDEIEVVITDKLLEEAVAEATGEPPEEGGPRELRSIRSAKRDIHEVDFTKWAASYDGPPFQVIHMDPPYGIQHHRSEQGGSAVHGAYSDEEKDFWEILQTLEKHKKQLVAPRCHIILWFSMKYYVEILDFFGYGFLTDTNFYNWEDTVVNRFPLVWHKTDNIGIVPDAKRYGRRVYETAFLISVGDRQINSVRPNLFSFPSGKADALHLSEKPFSMMNVMLSTIIEPERNVRFLDPCCGSGTAVAAAEFLGATSVTGLDRDPKSVSTAQRLLNSWRLRLIGAKDAEVNGLSEDELLTTGE